MNNKDKFVEQFGEEAFKFMVGTLKNSSNPGVDILEWFLEDYKELAVDTSYDVRPEFSYAIDKEILSKVEENDICKHSRRGGSRKGRGYDLKWYMDAVSDFYLGSAKNIEFKVSDDLSSGKKVESLDGYKTRWMVAVRELGLDEEIWVHKYYAGTCNECICLEKPNFNNSKAAGFKNMR